MMYIYDNVTLHNEINIACSWGQRWWIMQLPALDEGLLHPGGPL